MGNTEFREILKQLKEPFPPNQHQERKLPGEGKKWFFVTWQNIRERLDEVYPEWEVEWSKPEYVGQLCVITCTLTIAGVKRSAPGNAPLELISSRGKDMSRGTPVERAIADAFKNAAEAFGVCRYLDDQPFVIKYLQQKGDMRGYKFYQDNQQIDSGARGFSKAPARTITEKQQKRLWAIVKESALTNEDVKAIFSEFRLERTEQITSDKYDLVVNRIQAFGSRF